MVNLVLATIIIVIFGTAITYIIKEKKKGAVCIGCSHAGCCAGKSGKDSGCGCR